MTYVDAAVAPLRKTGQIKIHRAAAFEGMRKAGQLVARCLDMLTELVAPGVPTEKIDRLVFDYAMDHGALPATLMYRGYRKSTCTSLNHVVCHGIPADKPMKEGDIVSLDMGVVMDGFYGDSAITVGVGRITPAAASLLHVTEESLDQAIRQVRAGARLSDIGHAVQQCVEANGFSVVREFVGHGIGAALHEEPQIPNFGEPGRGPRLAEGMVLAIEPMVNAGKPAVRVLADGWTAVTRDGSLSAHFEHTVAVTADGARVLTRREATVRR